MEPNFNQQIKISAQKFLNHLLSKRHEIDVVLRKYQSHEVIQDEIGRTVEMLMNIEELTNYFNEKVDKISVFLPLNLPLYSFALFVAIPSYQCKTIVVRPPERMSSVFQELCDVLSLNLFFENVVFFEGQRQDFLDLHCKNSQVVIFTGKYENFLKIKEVCPKDCLLLFNGVGHNPVVVTESANINLAVERVSHLKLFNNGQDCAGPDMILVHSNVINRFIASLTTKLDQVVSSSNYVDDSVRIGPLFESSSLSKFSSTLEGVVSAGGEIIYGGVVDYKNNIIQPCVCKHSLKKYANYEELYSPVFVIAEYSDDSELDLYFNDSQSRYIQKQMYVSVFGHSDYVENNLRGTIPLINSSIHDNERGTEEYGGYTIAASAVSYGGMMIAKPVLIPREISNYMLSNYSKTIMEIPKKCSNPELYLIENEFKKVIKEIFGDNLVFGYIFGSYARNRARSYSDIDTLICIKTKNQDQISRYLKWLFELSEILGKIPDFTYPAEIVEFNKLEKAVNCFEKIRLTAGINSADDYDSMIWLHSLHHKKIGLVNPENIPLGWESVFSVHSSSILKGFLSDLREKLVVGSINKRDDWLANIPSQAEEVDNYISNLGNGRKLIDILKFISFESRPLFEDEVVKLVMSRPFFGRKVYLSRNDKGFFKKTFRYGVN